MVRAARPHIVRATAALAAVAAAMILGTTFGQIRNHHLGTATQDATAPERAIAAAALVVVVAAGILAVRGLTAAARAAMSQHEAPEHVAPVGLIISFAGYLAVAVCVLVLLERPVGGLLLGGALTGVLIGIAAQQVLANFFAGIVLMMVRPFTLADEIVLKSGPLGGEYEGQVVDMGLFYVKLETKTGPLSLPNAGVLASAVGPGVRAAAEPDEDDTAAESPVRDGGPP